MKPPSKFYVETTYDDLFEGWPKQEAEESGRKAFRVAINAGEDIEQIKKACEIYLLDNIGTDPTYIHRLGNFIREDHWKDYLHNDKLLKRKEEALVVIRTWNETCKRHWVKLSQEEYALVFAIKALADKAFRDNWSKALIKAEAIFRYPLREGDLKRNIILSFRWFCNISPEKHTVLKIIDGEYGQPIKEGSTKVKPSQQIDYEARNQLAEEMKEMFPAVEFKKPVVEPEEKQSIEISETAQKLADQLQSKNKKPNAATTQEIADKIRKDFGGSDESASGDSEEPLFS